jgi:hypothetical protein
MSVAKRQSRQHSLEAGTVARRALFALAFASVLLWAAASAAVEPTRPPPDVFVADPTPPPDTVAELTIWWTPGDGDGTIVLMKQGGPVDADPVDGTEHTANSVFGSGEEIGTGNFVVYLGTGTQVTVTNLQSDVPYFMELFSKNGTGGTIDYLQSSSARKTSGHNASHALDCSDCHFDPVPGGFHGSFEVPRNSAQETVCKTCHNASGDASDKAAVDVHTGPNFSTVVDCGSCHEIHNSGNTLISNDSHSGGVTAANRQWIRFNTTKYVAAAQQPALYQGRCTGNGSLSCNSDQDCSDAGAGTCDSTSFFAFGDANSPWNGLCQSCHTLTGSTLPTPESRHTNDSVTGPPGLNHGHETGNNCTECHTHQGQEGTDDGFTPQGGSCTGCHSSEQGSIPRRQITESSAGLGDGEFGTDFRSHHVNDGTGSQIVTKWDCVVCHAEGNVLTGSPDDTYHKKDGVQVKNVDNDSAYADWATLDPQDRSDFCMSCHDSDGAGLVGSRPVTPPDPGDPDVADYTNDALNPFKDGVTNAHEPDRSSVSMCEDLRTFCSKARDCNGIGGGTCNPLTAPHPRGRCSVSDAIACGTAYECPSGETCNFFQVVDVESQFNPAYTSHHAVRGVAYGTGSTPLTAAPGGVLAGAVFGNDSYGNPITWESTLNCEDCHYGTATNKLQAHGTANARYMLRDKAGGDTYPVPSGSGNFNVNCFRCHMSTGDPATYDNTLSAWSRHPQGQHTDDTINLFGIACLNCHGGAEFGGIHGVDGPVTDDDGGGSYEPNVFTWGSGLDLISNWTVGGSPSCSARADKTLLSDCTQHGSTSHTQWRSSTQTRTYRIP